MIVVFATAGKIPLYESAMYALALWARRNDAKLRGEWMLSRFPREHYTAWAAEKMKAAVIGEAEIKGRTVRWVEA